MRMKWFFVLPIAWLLFSLCVPVVATCEGDPPGTPFCYKCEDGAWVLQSYAQCGQDSDCTGECHDGCPPPTCVCEIDASKCIGTCKSCLAFSGVCYDDPAECPGECDWCTDGECEDVDGYCDDCETCLNGSCDPDCDPAEQECCNDTCCDIGNCCNNTTCCPNSDDVCCTDSGSYCCEFDETCCQGSCCTTGQCCDDGTCVSSCPTGECCDDGKCESSCPTGKCCDDGVCVGIAECSGSTCCDDGVCEALEGCESCIDDVVTDDKEKCTGDCKNCIDAECEDDSGLCDPGDVCVDGTCCDTASAGDCVVTDEDLDYAPENCLPQPGGQCKGGSGTYIAYGWEQTPTHQDQTGPGTVSISGCAEVTYATCTTYWDGGFGWECLLDEDLGNQKKNFGTHEECPTE